VDAVYGNDSTASVGGSPYLTIEAAISAISAAGSTGKTIWVLPGTYTLSAGITIPSGSSIRGLSLQTVVIQMLSVTSNTTLVTMGENTRLEDVTLKLTSSEHHTLTGINFPGTTTTTAKLRTSIVTVDNSSASFTGSSDVYGIHCNGTATGSLSSSFSFNSLKGSTINVYSNGGGNKRGVLVSSSNIVSTRDLNIYVAKPINASSSGSYVGVETNDSTYNLGSIQLRSTTVGCIYPSTGETYTASDILQTTPSSLTNPSYLTSPGIQIGPGVDLVSKSAGSKPFSTYIYPTTLYYGLKGNIKSAQDASGYLWPGTLTVNNGFPDKTYPYAFYRIQQPCLLSGISTSLGTAAGAGHSLTILVQYTMAGTTTIIDTSFNVIYGSTDLSMNYYDASTRLTTGDKIHLRLTNTGGNSNNAHDLTVQLDMF
jgi:hypothetical protein